MTRILFYTDLHLAASTPLHRIDDYPNTVLNKLQEVYQLAEEHKTDLIIFGGDLFDSHRTYSYDILSRAIELINKPTYAIVGQHDLIGYNSDTYATSSLCFLEKYCSNFKTIREPLELDDVVIYPSHVYDDFMESFTKKVNRKKKSILVAHHLITHEKTVFKTYLTSDFLPCQYSAVIFGDLHSGMETYYDEKETLVWSPGALSRKAINEITREVKVGILTVELGKRIEVEEIKLKSALLGDEVFGKTLLENIKQNSQYVNTEGFIKSISELEAGSIDIYDMIDKAAKASELKKETLEYILKFKNCVEN